MHISLRYCFKILADFRFAFLVLSEFSFLSFWLIDVFVEILFVRKTTQFHHRGLTHCLVLNGVSKSFWVQTLRKTTISYEYLIAICDQILVRSCVFLSIWSENDFETPFCKTKQTSDSCELYKVMHGYLYIILKTLKHK